MNVPALARACSVLWALPVFAAAAPATIPIRLPDSSVLEVRLPDWSRVHIIDRDLGHGVHMLQGFGGNVGVLVTPDGVLMVDSEFPELGEKIKSAVRKLSAKKIRYLVTTHFHWDHVGGAVGTLAPGATLIASEETARFIAEQQASDSKVVGQYPQDARLLPAITVSDRMTIRMGGEEVEILHVGPAHTGGDLIVRFKWANVIQTGDTFFSGFFPSIDVDHGGTIDGAIAFCEQLHALSDEHTRIIPGHGDVTDRAYIARYRAMLVTVRQRIAEEIRKGRTIEQTIADRPLADLEQEWGGDLLKGRDIAALVYADLKRKVRP